MSDDRKTILSRLYIVYFMLFLFALGILYKLFAIQFIEGAQLQARSEDQTTSLRTMEAVRGNIYSDDGSLLATSVPIYEVRMDPNTAALNNDLFYGEVGVLAAGLSKIFPHKSTANWKRELKEARADGQRFFLIGRNVEYYQLQELKKLPLFKLGRYKGGFIAIRQNHRERPFNMLAARTIGYDREGLNPVGLEGAYRTQLRGVSGSQLMQRISGGVWMPLRDENEVEPEDGSDLHTTIDINIQDVAEQALLEQLKRHDADHGCVILMEVQTGYIKAIANLSRSEEGIYYEHYNYAIGESTEPGSVFKLQSLIAALEDGLIELTDSVDTEDGTYKFYDRVMRDSHEGGHGKITVQRAFEVSSNVGISKVIAAAYQNNAAKYTDRLHKMNLGQSLNLEIYGEGRPVLKTPQSKDWSGVSLPWMSIGYEVQQTPMQTLTFYNAIANNGKMVKPLFVSDITKHGKVVRHFDPVVLNNSICSKATIEKVKGALEGVVETGTAMNLRHSSYGIAGKTGTAQIANDKYGYKYESKVSHQASFVGYFPAKAPKYSCIVVVNAPSRNVYYGNIVAGPIFKEIADKVCATRMDLQSTFADAEEENAKLPYSKHGHRADLTTVFAELGVPTETVNPKADFVVTQTGTEKVVLDTRKTDGAKVPNVLGMGANDAMHILENKGLSVEIKGRGTVVQQSLQPGMDLRRGQHITLVLAG